MATDDRQVIITGSGPAPQSWVIPGAGQIEPKCVYAKFDGTNAGGPFVPALKLYSDGGTVVGIFVAPQQIAAGGSANVSWFLDGADNSNAARPDVDTTGTINNITSSAATLAVTNPSGPTTNLDLPTSGVTAGTYGDASDVAQVTVNAQGIVTGAASVSIVGGGVVVGSDGWVNDTAETWTFASFAAGPPAVGTFTVSGDVRSKYTVGARIKLVQTTTKYFVVSTDPTFGGGNTTVSISGGTDYTLANAAISGNFHSYVVNPQGFPTWFVFAAGTTGITGASVNTSLFALTGRMLDIQYDVSGTSNATTKTLSSPCPVIPAASAVRYPGGTTENAGVFSSVVGAVQPTGGGSSTITLSRDVTGASWTNSGAWRMTFGVTIPI